MSTPSSTSSVSDPPPPTVNSLPDEILDMIISQNDQQSGVSCARVSRRFKLLVREESWDHLNLSSSDVADKALTERVRVFMSKSDFNRKLGMIKSVKITSHPSAGNKVIPLFRKVTRNLEQLEIVRAPGRKSSSPKEDTFDYRILRGTSNRTIKLTLPNLTYLCLNQGSIRFARALNTLCASAPNLIHLELELKEHQIEPSHRLLAFPISQADTKLERLRLTYHGTGQAPGVEAFVRDLIQRSPHLHALSIDSQGSGLLRDATSMLDVVGAASNLQEVHFLMGTRPILERPTYQSRFTPPKFPSIKRLTFASADWATMLPELLAVESMFIREAPWDHRLPKRPYSRILSAISPDTAKQLRRCTKFRYIHDISTHPIEFSEDVFNHYQGLDPSGTIRSWRHGEEEILHLRFLRDRVSGHQSDDFTQTPVELLPASAWLHYTDFRGMLIPLELLEKMEEAEGMEAGRWERGMKVSADGWAILVDGMSGVRKAEYA